MSKWQCKILGHIWDIIPTTLPNDKGTKDSIFVIGFICEKCQKVCKKMAYQDFDYRIKFVLPSARL